MKKLKRHFKDYKNTFAGIMFAAISFLLLAPISMTFAVIFAIGMLFMPFIGQYLPIGILGDNTPGTEADLLKKFKGTLEEWGGDLRTKITELESKTMGSVNDKLNALENKWTNFKDVTEFKTLVKELADLGVEVKALKEKGLPTEQKTYKTVREAITAAVLEKKSEIDAIVAAGGKQASALNIEFKSVDVMSVASTIAAGSTQVSITENTGIISTIRKREIQYLANVSVGSIGTNRAMWIEETDEEGTPIMIGENTTKTQLDVQYVEQTMAVKKIAVHGKVTTELMADIPQLVSYIESNLMKRMDIVIENQLFSGNNTGANLKGLSEYATAFDISGTEIEQAIQDANELDVIEAVALQVALAFGTASALFIHPSTMAKIKLIKDDAGRPVWKDYITTNGLMNISGMNIIPTTAVTAGEFMGGDMSVVKVLNREDMGIQIGLDGNDFTKNLKTILLEKRLVQFVSANDTAVLVKGVFADAIADLEVVAAP